MRASHPGVRASHPGLRASLTPARDASIFGRIGAPYARPVMGTIFLVYYMDTTVDHFITPLALRVRGKNGWKGGMVAVREGYKEHLELPQKLYYCYLNHLLPVKEMLH